MTLHDDHLAAADSWDDRISAFWSEADDERPVAMWAALDPLLAERPQGGAAAAFERAPVHDLLGEEHAAISLHAIAIDAGTDPERHGYATIQLASTLRNVGRLGSAKGDDARRLVDFSPQADPQTDAS